MGYIGGLYSGIRYVAAALNSQAEINNLDSIINNLVSLGRENEIVSIFMMPKAFYTTGGQPRYNSVSMSKPSTVDGYTPRNKKLLTYPYVFAGVDTGNDVKHYRYEYSNHATLLNFTLMSSMSPNPEIVVAPRQYNGSAGMKLDAINPTETVTCSGFPQCACIIDSYRAWIAQKAVSEGVSIAGLALTSAASFATGNIAGAALSGLGAMQQVLSSINETMKGSKARGNQGTSTEVATRIKGIYFKQMNITAQYARTIDDFFDRYGYTTNRIKIPNRNSRPYWTYTKTRDCAIKGSIPTTDLAKIKEIYNNGITFWKDFSYVGNYSLNNSPS